MTLKTPKWYGPRQLATLLDLTPRQFDHALASGLIPPADVPRRGAIAEHVSGITDAPAVGVQRAVALLSGALGVKVPREAIPALADAGLITHVGIKPEDLRYCEDSIRWRGTSGPAATRNERPEPGGPPITSCWASSATRYPPRATPATTSPATPPRWPPTRETAMGDTPPVPARLASRPTMGGLVVPWISVHHADGRATLGAVHGSRVAACLRGRRCQTCGTPLDARAVLLARPQDFTRGYVAEPALHPECAAYSVRACPMLNGTMPRYRPTPHRIEGRPCDTPGCGCAGWVPVTGPSPRRGSPADPYWSVWLRPGGYRLAVDPGGTLLGIALTGARPAKIRLVSRGHPTPEQETVIRLLGLPWDAETPADRPDHPAKDTPR